MSAAPARDPVLVVRDAAIGYQGRAVLTGIDLTVHRGEVVALLGANGSGKSTLVRGVIGLAQVLSGTIELFGERGVPKVRDRWRIGYVPQRHTVARGVPSTVSEVVSAGRLPLLRAWRRSTRQDRACVRSAIATVGLAGRERDPVAALSGGQQRRVLIARALAAQSELLILDEPTAGVDTEHQQILADTMASLTEAGTTIVLVTHELGPAAAVVTRAVLLRGGKVAYDGRPDGASADGEDRRGDHHHIADERPSLGPFGLRRRADRRGDPTSDAVVAAKPYPFRARRADLSAKPLTG
ncbi:MAG: metal ABC transporter ATP-binding protein [Acidimicrobiales bacterium]